MLQNYWKLRIKQPQRIENCVMFSFFIRRRKNLVKWARQRMAYYSYAPSETRGSQSGREKRRDESFQARVRRGWQLCKFIGKKGSFYSYRISLGHQHGCRFIVLGQQYDGRDVTWKPSVAGNLLTSHRPCCWTTANNSKRVSHRWELNQSEINRRKKKSLPPLLTFIISVLGSH